MLSDGLFIEKNEKRTDSMYYGGHAFVTLPVRLVRAIGIFIAIVITATAALVMEVVVAGMIYPLAGLMGHLSWSGAKQSKVEQALTLASRFKNL